ncbi:hypothetical protein [Deinococcus multiflagellatus]|uniref:Uncharacterized protein n=1 Tax=Deinococcus multiflagellatus TaxID=1656887 RepID=A0ABW1ZPX9_9DEIO|nr:hypothetical protein [Deinococcus multiflagellatus]MBZ9715615.1 hypothetical protein [Deinococcus multiflagellatus]
MLAWLWKLLWRPAAPLPAAPATLPPDEPPWVALSRTAVHDELPTVQKAAAAWLAGLSTLSGLLAVAGVTAGTAALDGRLLLGRFDTYWLGVTLLVSILLTSAAATLSAVQATSTPWATGSTDPAKLEQRWYTTIDAIRGHLTWSRRWISVTVGALLLYALLVLLSVKPDPPPAAYVRVITGAGVYCGLLVTSGSRQLVLHPRTGKPGKGQEQTTDAQGIVLPGSVTDITPVTGCPANALPTK